MSATSIFNPSSVDEYLQWLLRRGRKESTILRMHYTLRKGGEGLAAVGASDPEEVTPEDIIAMEQSLDLKESTRRGVVVAVGCYLRWLTGEDLVRKAGIRWNGGSVERKWITSRDYKRMMIRANQWQRLVLALGATMGLRRSEIARLTLEDVQDGIIVIHGKGCGPEGKIEEKPMTEAVRKELEMYLRVRKPSDSNVLLISYRGTPMNAGSIANSIVKLGRECGVELSMHSLRRLYAMTMADAEIPLETIMRMMRHSRPEVTVQCYLRADPRRMALASEAVDEALLC